MQDEIAVAFGGRIFSDVKFAEEAFELILLVDVVIVFEHGEGKALAESARADEEEIHVRFFYFLYEWGLVNIVTISCHYILKVLHSVRDALAIDSLLSFYFCHNRNQFLVLCRKVKIIIWNEQSFWGFFLVVYQKMSSFADMNLLCNMGIKSS